MLMREAIAEGCAEPSLDLTTSGSTRCLALPVLSLTQRSTDRDSSPQTQMISAERLIAYQTLPQEEALTSDAPPPAEWPARGEIVARGVSMRYRAGLEPSLRDVSFHIEGGSLCGIVGRTGAGKSSLLAALFRLVEPHEGYIEVDGIRTDALGLHELRPRLAIIMQQPLLFSGTVRQQLDPLGTQKDDAIWKALEDARVASLVRGLEGGLEARVVADGGNFSQGERQLLCLARALLARTSVLIMDEATANVDNATDEKIQAAVRSNYRGTILMIAHRLLTIRDAAKILVFSGGALVEAGHPAELLKAEPDRERINFASMVEDAGIAPDEFLAGRLENRRLASEINHSS